MVMPAVTLAAARVALGDMAGARPLLDGTRAWLARQRAQGFEHPHFSYLEARIEALDSRPGEAMAALRRAVVAHPECGLPDQAPSAKPDPRRRGRASGVGLSFPPA